MSEVSPQVEIVIPVRNEERDLATSVRRLAGYLRRHPANLEQTLAKLDSYLGSAGRPTA